MQSCSSYRKPPSNKSMGIEIEGYFPDSAANGVEGSGFFESSTYRGFWYITTDGSITSPTWNYFAREYVSQPLTPSWLKKEIKKLYKAVPLESNESCGIHIHVNRKWCNLKRAEAIWTFLCAMDDEDRKELFGRGDNSYSKYTGPFQASRYQAINTENKNTIEFRMFSSGNEEWALWCVDLVTYLVDNAKHLNMSAILAFRDMWWKTK